MVVAVERAYKAIREGILGGAYRPGAHLRAQDLALANGVSRTPVREAMLRLQAEGLIRVIPNRGAFVSGMEESDIVKIYDLRIMLEGYAAGAAAEEASESQIEALATLARRMADIVESNSAEGAVDIPAINNEFHKLIVTAAASPRLEVALASIVEAPLVLRTFRRFSPDELRRSANQHLELVDAVRARDSQWARSVMSNHILAGRNALLRSIESQLDAPSPRALSRI